MEFEAVIGLETHVQLATISKIFCSASAAYGGDPNEHVDSLTLGLPGALPVLNRRAVEFAIMLGLATECEIRRFNRFARKHYFYPDLPKGYQISQYDEPICERGTVQIEIEGKTRSIGIKRIHMEEDAGKNIHDSRTHSSLIDLNRAGVPLLEVVTDPDIRTPAEAGAYLKAIRQLVRFLGISDGNMEEGSLRCDANISLRPAGSLTLGTRTEVKNLNSFKFVERALEYEIARQMSVLRSGGKVEQETLLFDSATGTTRSLRSKEDSADYRYFPDPDLPPVIVDDGWIARVRGQMPTLPRQAKDELINKYGLSPYDAAVLTGEKVSVEFFYQTLGICPNAKLVCNWITSELFGALNSKGIPLEQSPISASNLGGLLKRLEDGTLSGKMAKTVFAEMFETSSSADEIIKAKGLKQIVDDGPIKEMIKQVIEANASQFQEYLDGNDRLHPFFVGQVIKLAKGSANPQKVNELISAEVAARRQK